MQYFKSSDGKSVYSKDGYVYSEFHDFGSLYATQYMTYHPPDDIIEKYKKDLSNSYYLACKYFNCEIVSINENEFITRCPKYDGTLLDYFSDKKIKKNNLEMLVIFDKLVDIIVYLANNNISHDDLAFRNICYIINNDELKLYLIDFDQLNEDSSWHNSIDNFNLNLTYLYHDIKEILGNDMHKLFVDKLLKKFQVLMKL